MRFNEGVPVVTQEPKGRIGSAFDEFLKDEGIFEAVQAGALKKVVAHRRGEGGGCGFLRSKWRGPLSSN